MEAAVEKMSINGVAYIREDCVQEQNDSGPKDIRIVVLQRGWIVVGEYVRSENRVYISNASVIRAWGTSQGLGELAKKGPLSNTKLDSCNGLVEAHTLAVVLTIKCEASKWKNL